MPGYMELRPIDNTQGHAPVYSGNPAGDIVRDPSPMGWPGHKVRAYNVDTGSVVEVYYGVAGENLTHRSFCVMDNLNNSFFMADAANNKAALTGVVAADYTAGEVAMFVVEGPVRTLVQPGFASGQDVFITATSGVIDDAAVTTTPAIANGRIKAAQSLSAYTTDPNTPSWGDYAVIRLNNSFVDLTA